MAWTYDAGNLSLGTCKISIDKGDGEVAVGLTQNAQIINYTPSFQDIMANETGETLINKLLKGESMKVSFEMLERTGENFLSVFPMATEFGTTTKSRGIGATQGSSLLTECFKVHLHPINTSGTAGADDETVLTDDWYFWKCANSGAVSIEFTKDGLRSYKAELDVFVDSTKPAGMQLALNGDPANTTLDTTPPTLSSVKVEKSDVLTAVVTGTELTGVDATTTIEIVASEALTTATAINHKNFALAVATTDAVVDLSGATITYTSATKTILITPASSLTAGASYVLAIQGLKDTAGNEMVPVVKRFAITA